MPAAVAGDKQAALRELTKLAGEGEIPCILPLIRLLYGDTGSTDGDRFEEITLEAGEPTGINLFLPPTLQPLLLLNRLLKSEEFEGNGDPQEETVSSRFR